MRMDERAEQPSFIASHPQVWVDRLCLHHFFAQSFHYSRRFGKFRAWRVLTSVILGFWHLPGTIRFPSDLLSASHDAIS